MDQQATQHSEIMAYIDRVRQGDSEAFDLLVKRFHPMLSAMTVRFSEGLCEADAAEVAQEAKIAFYRATCSYRSADGGVTFGLYARICVRNALITRYREQCKRVSTCSLDDLDEVMLPTAAADPASRIIEEEEVAALHQKIEKVLSPYEQSVFEGHIAGKTPRVIAEELHRSEKSVSNAIFRIQQKLRAVLDRS